jgi:hypothetical protein
MHKRVLTKPDGSEIGAGVFTADTVPEEKVKELQAVEVNVDA